MASEHSKTPDLLQVKDNLFLNSSLSQNRFTCETNQEILGGGEALILTEFYNPTANTLLPSYKKP